MNTTVTHAIRVLTSVVVEALGRRKRKDLAEADIEVMSAFRTLFDAQRKSWRAELASAKGRISKLEARLKELEPKPIGAIPPPNETVSLWTGKVTTSKP